MQPSRKRPAMNKELPGTLKWRVVKCVVRTVEVVLGLFVLFVLFVFLGEIPFDFVGLLLFGWIAYLGRVLPQITFNWEIAFDAAVALALALFGLHRILAWWAKRGENARAKWRFGNTLKIGVMVLLLFATSISAVGMVHQIGWLCREPRLIYMSGFGRQTMELSQIKQVVLGLSLFASDHDGWFPKELDELVPDYLDTHRYFFTRAMDSDPPQRIIYYTGYGTGFRTPENGNTIILASPRPFESLSGRKRAVAYLDTSAAIISETSYQEQIQKQKMAVRDR
jgi:hypothetical protein